MWFSIKNTGFLSSTANINMCLPETAGGRFGSLSGAHYEPKPSYCTGGNPCDAWPDSRRLLASPLDRMCELAFIHEGTAAVDVLNYSGSRNRFVIKLKVQRVLKALQLTLQFGSPNGGIDNPTGARYMVGSYWVYFDGNVQVAVTSLRPPQPAPIDPQPSDKRLAFGPSAQNFDGIQELWIDHIQLPRGRPANDILTSTAGCRTLLLAQVSFTARFTRAFLPMPTRSRLSCVSWKRQLERLHDGCASRAN